MNESPPEPDRRNWFLIGSLTLAIVATVLVPFLLTPDFTRTEKAILITCLALLFGNRLLPGARNHLGI